MNISARILLNPSLGVLVGLALAACGSPSDEDLDPSATYTTFGRPFEPAAALPAQAVLAEAKIYAGDAVMIEGLAAECADDPCWMRMTSGDTAEIRILAPDFTVPDTLAGRRIVVHGTLTSPDTVGLDTTSPDAGSSSIDSQSPTLDLRPTGLMVEKVR